MNPDLILIGTITGTHGLDGAVRLRPVGEPAMLEGLKRVYVQDRGWVAVKRLELHAREPVLRLAGVTTLDAAEGLRGQAMYANKADLKLQDGVYYYHDLIGLPVRSPTGQALGTIKDMMDSGPQDILIVRHESRDVLVPLQAPYVRVLDGFIEIDPIPGLFEP
jgi:16S rRNA processing protein RimM